MKDVLKSITNAPIIKRLRLMENKRVERYVQRRKLVQTKLNDTAVALDKQMKADLRDQIQDLNDLLMDGYNASIDE